MKRYDSVTGEPKDVRLGAILCLTSALGTVCIMAWIIWTLIP